MPILFSMLYVAFSLVLGYLWYAAPMAQIRSAQRHRTLRLIEEYVGNLRRDIADVHLRSIHAAGLDTLHFAWAGSLEAGQRTITACMARL